MAELKRYEISVSRSSAAVHWGEFVFYSDVAAQDEENVRLRGENEKLHQTLSTLRYSSEEWVKVDNRTLRADLTAANEALAAAKGDGERMKVAAVYAYLAIYREGWEEGISAEEAGSRVSDLLSDGLNTADEMIAWLATRAAATETGGEG